MITTIQILYDKDIYNNYANADRILADFLLTTRRGADLEKINDTDIHDFIFKK